MHLTLSPSPISPTAQQMTQNGHVLNSAFQKFFKLVFELSFLQLIAMIDCRVLFQRLIGCKACN